MTTPHPTPLDATPGAAPLALPPRGADAAPTPRELAEILERITDAFFALDRDWRFTYVNDEAERLLARTRGELLGRGVWTEFPEAVGSTFEREYRRAVAEGRTTTFEEWYAPLERRFEVRAYPSAGGLSVFFRDVTARHAAEQAMARLEADRQLALEAGQMGTWEWDIAAGVVSWSPQEERLYGIPEGSFEGTVAAYSARIHPDDRADAWRRVEEAMARRAESHHVRHRIVRPDGEVRWLDSHGRFVYGADGRPLRLVGVSTDVTEREAMEEALRYQHYITETITNNATAALFMMDADGHPTYMNPAAEAMTGFTLAEIRDFPLHYAIHHHRPDGSPYPMAECPVDRALPENFDVRAHEDVFIRKDGTTFPVLCAASPIFENGRPVGTVVEVRDVTEQRHRERALRESEERFEALVEATEQYIWTNSAAGEMTGEQPGWARLTGQSPAEFGGYGWASALHPDDADRTVRRWQEAVAARSLFEAEHRVRRADGQYRDFWVRALPLLDAAGEVREWVGVHTDITERKALEARLRLLTDAIPVQVWTATPDGRLDYVSERVTGYFGQPPEGVLGDAWHRFVHPDDLPSAGARWGASLASGDPYEVEFRLRRGGDGAYRWHLARALALRDASGAIERWFGSNTDIHDQKLAEAARDRALAEVERERGRLHEVLEQAPAAVSITSGPEHVTVMQNARSRQIAGRDIMGKAAREVFPELAEQGIVELLDRVYRTGEPFVANELAVKWDRDGDGVPETPAYFNVVYQAVRDAAGAVTGVLTHSVEVTEQVLARHEIEAKAEELARLTHALERSNRELDQFAYVASHDLKAPLRGIANLAQWIEEDLGERVTGESAEHMRLLKGRVHRMEGLIDGILAYSRAGRTRAPLELVDTGALVREAVELLAAPAGVTILVPSDLPAVQAERVPLQQVFMNLIGNAVKYGVGQRPDLTVRVTWADQGAAHEFAVSDDGPGIAPAFHERIWGIFQTLEARDKVESTGIGLSVVKKIVESRGGRAWVESDVGQGATFRFTWPKIRVEER